MRALANARKTVRIAVAVGTTVAAAAGAVWLGAAPAGPARTGGVGAVRAAGIVRASVADARATSTFAPGEPPLPVSLSGTVPPRLPIESGGRLAKTRAVRDFFDYFLTAQHEVPAVALETMVRREIAAQLEGTAAQTEALDVWRRYRAYRDALTRVAALQAPTQPTIAAAGGPSNLDAMQAALGEGASIANRTMGTAWSEAFFGREWRRVNFDLMRLRVITDATLDDAQKAARLQALADMLPPEERAASEREARLRAAVTEIAALQKQSLPLDALRAAATQTLGPEAAQRVVQMQKDDDAWRAQYEAYAAQRARIDARGLAPPERDAQIAQLRERMFATVGDRLRALSLDKGATMPPG
jgi:lipase chaperone LimK